MAANDRQNRTAKVLGKNIIGVALGITFPYK